MAKNDRDRLIKTFLSRNRRTAPGVDTPNTPRVSGTSSYRPVKQGTLTSKVPGASGQAPRPQDLAAAREYAARRARRPPERNQRIARY